MKKIVFLAFVSVLLLMSMHGGEFVMTASSSTANHVYSGQSIQEAVNSAQSGDTIFVHAGTSYEQVVVNKSVLLIGEDDGSTIIDGNSTGNVICVTANNVKITGFTVQNSGHDGSGIRLDYSSGNNISNNIITNNDNGVTFWYSNNNTLNGNNASNNLRGIYFRDGSSNNVLTSNIVSSNNYTGIDFEGGNDNTVLTGNIVSNNQKGIDIGFSTNNVLTGNIVSSNSYIGISINGCFNNTLVGNIVSNNRRGIDVDGSSDNVLTGNIVSSNIWTGIGLHGSSNNVLAGNNVTNNGYGISANNHTIHGWGIGLFSCENNTIYHNNFIDNFINNASQVWSSVSTNFWNHGGEGNYWSDYEGVDRDGDGIGDSPYVIDEKNRDKHPLMSPWTPKWHPTPLWMRWWFWIIVTAGIVALAGAIYFRKKRKPPTPTAPPPPEKTPTHL